MTPVEQRFEKQACIIIDNLKKRNMEGLYFATSKEAVDYLLSNINKEDLIGYGGSMTISECGLMDALKQNNYNVIDRTAAKNELEKKQINTRIFNSKYFLMSTNAITLDGILVNIDGMGSRLGFMLFGPENVIIVVGRNKIASSVEDAYQRIKTYACPANAIRLGLNDLACARTGKCVNCFADKCICSQIVVTRRSTIKNRIKVILINEDLGY